MEIEITTHAKERMRKYNVSTTLVVSTIEHPTSTMEGYNNRTIYQKKLNGHILRVIVEES